MNKSMKLLSLAFVAAALTSGCNQSDSPSNTAPSESLPTTVEAPAAIADAAPAVAVVMETYDATTAPAAGGNCALDAVNGGAPAGASVAAGSEVMFGGWIADAANQVPTEARLVLIGETSAYSAPLIAGGVRPDVATALNSEALASSGFNLLARMDVAPGNYQLSIVHGAGEAVATCKLGSGLVVSN